MSPVDFALCLQPAVQADALSLLLTRTGADKHKVVLTHTLSQLQGDLSDPEHQIENVMQRHECHFPFPHIDGVLVGRLGNQTTGAEELCAG